MASVVAQQVFFPGVNAPTSCTYCASHGTSPGTAILTMNPQLALPAQYGDLVFTDTVNGTITIPGCRVDRLDVEIGSEGQQWVLTIVDRRWKWSLGHIEGSYNQIDPHGKLIAWTIRSPFELATLCLQAMGETAYTINLPVGLPASVGQNLRGFIPQGINFPPTGTNPPVNWYGIPPATALNQLADQYGCRVIYDPISDSILVGPIGFGADLPPGSLAKEGPAMKAPETPDSVCVVGAPVRYQGEFDVIAVGEEWDGSYRPINDLSYAPVTKGQPQVVKYQVVFDGKTAGLTYQVAMFFDSSGDPSTGLAFAVTTAMGNTAATIANALANRINSSGDPRIAGQITASVKAASTPLVGSILTLTAKQNNVSFPSNHTITNSVVPSGNFIGDFDFKPPLPTGPNWFTCPPPNFPSGPGFGIQATDRLTQEQAVALAQKSVFRMYQLSGVDVNDAAPPAPTIIPGYGPIRRIQQVVLTDTQCLQILPKPGDQNLLNQFGEPLIVNYYNGYSRDVPAAVYGSISVESYDARFWGGDAFTAANTGTEADPAPQVYIPFSIDPVWQMIIFSEYVYYYDYGGGRVEEPELTLVTAVNVRDPDTNQLVAYQKTMPLPGVKVGTNPKTQVYSDVQLDVIGVYDTSGRIIATTLLSADPLNRAQYYLNGLAAQYWKSNALVQEYNGLIPINLDGAIQQVTWTVGDSGCSTTASRNTEHNFAIPPYPARRYFEMLPPIQNVNLRNARDESVLRPFIPGKG